MGPVLSPRERREAVALAADLDVLRPGEAAISPRVHDALEAIGVEFPHSYGVEEADGKLRVCDVTGKRFDIARLVSIYLRQDVIEQRVSYDPRFVQPAQRNRAILSAQLRQASVAWAIGFWRSVMPDASDQLRVLACDGASLLGWVGGFARHQFDARDRARLQLLSGAIQRRLLHERRLREASLSFAALDATLDALPGAAFILDPKLRVVHRNRAAGNAEPLNLELTPILAPGLPKHWLARERVPGRFTATGLARRFGLTPAETKVLTLVAKGHTNRAIAVELACSERTVEVHLTRLLEKTDAESRGELVACVCRTTE